MGLSHSPHCGDTVPDTINSVNSGERKGEQNCWEVEDQKWRPRRSWGGDEPLQAMPLFQSDPTS